MSDIVHIVANCLWSQLQWVRMKMSECSRSNTFISFVKKYILMSPKGFSLPAN